MKNNNEEPISLEERKAYQEFYRKGDTYIGLLAVANAQGIYPYHVWTLNHHGEYSKDTIAGDVTINYYEGQAVIAWLLPKKEKRVYAKLQY